MPESFTENRILDDVYTAIIVTQLIESATALDSRHPFIAVQKY